MKKRTPKEVWEDTVTPNEAEQAYESGKIILKGFQRGKDFMGIVSKEMKDLNFALGGKVSEDRLFNLVLWGIQERINENTDWKRGRK